MPRKSASPAPPQEPRCRRIESHAHTRLLSDPASFTGSPAAYVKRMRKEGIDAIVLLAPGATCKKAVARFGDFVIPVAMYRLGEFATSDLRGDMEYWLEHGCKGIKFIAPHHPYSDERYWPMYQMVADHGAVAVFHTGYLGFPRGGPQIPPIEIVHMRPAHVDAVARRFPTLKILMAHYGNPWWEEAWKVTWYDPNVYADLSGGTAYRRDLTMWRQTFAPNGQLMADTLGKVCFGSDTHYLHDGRHGFAPYIDFYQKLLDRVAAPETLRRRVWAGNVKKLFGVRW